MSERGVLKTLRLSPDEMARVMNDLDHASSPQAEVKRSYRRWRFRGTLAVISITNEHGSRTNYAVEPRDLSSTGMGVIHGSFIHPRTVVQVGLRKLDGGVASLRAEVVRCRMLSAGVYEVGIRFEDRIDPMDVIASDQEQVFQNERVELGDLEGVILFICGNRVEQRLMAHHFAGSNVDLVYARRGDEACAMLEDQPSLIFVDHAVDDWGGVALLSRLREAGASCPIVLMSADRWTHIRDEAMDAGADDVLMKPLPEALLHQATAEYLEKRAGGAEDAGSVHFTVVSAAGVGVELDLLEDFVNDLRDQASEIASAAEKGDMEMLRRRALEVRGSAKDFGFATVSERADDLLNAIAKNQEGMIESTAARLCERCERCKAVE